MTSMITAMAAMRMVANNNMVEAVETMQQAIEIRETETARKIKKVYSYKAKKEVENYFEVYMVDNNDQEYTYVVTFCNGGYVKGNHNDIVSAINRNSKYTAIMQGDELALVWNGNNAIMIDIDDALSDTDYYWALYNGIAID